MVIEWLQRISEIFPDKENRPVDPAASHSPVVERRVLLSAPAALAASFLLKHEMPESVTKLSFEEFTKQATSNAARITAATDADEEEYVLTMASLAVRLKEVPPVQFGEPFKSVMWSALSYRGSGIPVALIQWRMNPNSVYPAHNHPNYSGMTLGLLGECRMRNFDYVGPKPDYSSNAVFRIRETQDTVLSPGRVTSLMTTTRDNIHELHAGNEGVTGLDIVTRMAGPAEGFAFLNVRSKAQDEAKRIYEATWDEHIKQGA
jgi:hypothetical protein